MSSILKILIVFAVSSIRFLAGPAVSFGMGLNFLQTWLSTSAGGIIGVIFFFFISRWLLLYYEKHFQTLKKKLKVSLTAIYNRIYPVNDNGSYATKYFTHRRLLVKAVRNYGLISLVILTPVAFSIPFGTFLATRYYSSNKYLLVYLSTSVLLWSLFMSSAISLF